jgi:hypothetical protein
MTPRRILDQPISNFPSETWFREVSDADFNCHDDQPSALVSPSHSSPTGSLVREPFAPLDSYETHQVARLHRPHETGVRRPHALAELAHLAPMMLTRQAE